MAGNSDYIPRQDVAFLEFAKTLLACAHVHFEQFGVPDPQGEMVLLGIYETKLEAAQDPNRGKVDVLAKNESRDALEKAVRAYCKAYLLYNPKVTDEDRERMGLPVYSGGHHPVPVPDSVPVLTVKLKNPREIPIYYHDSMLGKRGKPAGVHGIEIRWAILDHFPSDIEAELTKSAFDTRSPCVLKFAEYERGKRVYMCGRWEISREGQKGSDGEITEAVIP
jgi:phosphoribosylformylglycinamidine (FGAM) synthase PurS component